MTREYVKFKWSHQMRLHRWGVRAYNAALRHIPISLKYRVGRRLRVNRPPYSLVNECSLVVQVGAPLDTLHAGRSRGMYFSLLARPDSRVVIVEPDPESVEELRAALERLGISNTEVCPLGAWSEKKTLKLYVNQRHPASNFTEGTANYDSRRLKAYSELEVEVDQLDSILAARGISKADLVSINTNGAEKEILAGMEGLISAGLPYVALARTRDDLLETMAGRGYEFYAHDDRGYTFRQTVQPSGRAEMGAVEEAEPGRDEVSARR